MQFSIVVKIAFGRRIVGQRYHGGRYWSIYRQHYLVRCQSVTKRFTNHGASNTVHRPADKPCIDRPSGVNSVWFAQFAVFSTFGLDVISL